MVLTTTPVLRPPMIPNPRPLPSLMRFITSTCAHSVFNCERKDHETRLRFRPLLKRLNDIVKRLARESSTGTMELKLSNPVFIKFHYSIGRSIHRSDITQRDKNYLPRTSWLRFNYGKVTPLLRDHSYRRTRSTNKFRKFAKTSKRSLSRCRYLSRIRFIPRRTYVSLLLPLTTLTTITYAAKRKD